ncbi:hypothetical protein DPMN_107954 [Dreissena polymorpha]|uniref:Reverse transcriptase domain-containing protein n=1 Tax=Dreissena polymorpha TaxID=45954 RepID=A0A9D4K7M9_DREPO|nr:hypothetical protein DPMN_107954 [Dreissena polymorpha]
MVKMYNDLLETIDKNLITIVIMIDQSVAFDTIDIPIFIQILQNEFGIQSTPLKWIESYLTNKTMKVWIEQSSSNTAFEIRRPPRLLCWTSDFNSVYIGPQQGGSEVSSLSVWLCRRPQDCIQDSGRKS